MKCFLSTHNISEVLDYLIYVYENRGWHIMDPISLELAKVGISVTTKAVLEKIYSSISEKKWPFGRSLLNELLKEENYLEFLIKHVSRTIKIRTIHSSDKDVYLNEIYHPVRISEVIHDLFEVNTMKIDDEFLLKNNKINNIIGYAGQGKSTALRKVFIEYIKHGDKLPFFIELHKAEKSGVLKQLELILLECGLPADEEKIKQLISCGKIILLLDGFDEVTPSKRKDILTEILSLNQKYEVQIITTTRPETNICHEPSIINYKVELLGKNDILSILQKLNKKNESIDEGFLERISEILRGNSELVSVMNLPILVTLFYVCYPYLDKMPSNAVDFYSSLFMTLYSRHDKVKNFERYKASEISNNKAFYCFCALSFTSLYNNDLNFNEISLNNYVENSMLLNSLNINEHLPEKLVSDFINVTCLIQKDGYDKYVYLHKSVQEYHASEFIRNSNVDNKEKFYKFLLNDFNTDKRFLNVINFLISTDKENVIKLILLPLCESSGIDKWDDPDDDIVSEIYEDIVSFSSVILRENNLEVFNNKIRAVSFSSRSDKYKWVNQFFKAKNEKFSNTDADVGYFYGPVCSLVFGDSEITKALTDEVLSKNEIPYLRPNGKVRVNGKDRIPLKRLLDVTDKVDFLRQFIKDTMIELNKSLYKENKEKINKLNDNLKKAFPFL